MQGESRVAWREGSFLRPQHFQQQDRFFDALIRARTEQMRPHAWGLVGVKLNDDLAALGKFAVERLGGLLPDGQPFASPEDAPPPEPLDVPADTRDAVVYLTLPARQANAAEFQSSDRAADTFRFIALEESAMDSFSDARVPQLIEVARPNVRFGVTRAQTDGRICLGLARVREVLNGRVLFDDRYIPPCLDLRASPRLAGMLTDIIGRAQQRTNELALRSVESTDGGADTISSFLLLIALNRWTPVLSHLASLPSVHPERLYEVFVAMAGELTTLVPGERKPPPFPAYDHEDLQATFEPVFELLQAALSAIFDRSAVQLPLDPRGYGAYLSIITDSKLYESGYFYLAVNAAVPLEEVRARFPSIAKIGAFEKMQQIVESALPGVPLRHVPTPPPQLRVLPGYVYFELDRSAANWRDFATASALGLHVAGDWPDLKLELWCVKRKER